MTPIEKNQRYGRNTLVALCVIAIAIYFGFTPLFDLIKGGVAGNVVGASFSAIFVIVLTMYLLNKQTEIEQESKKGEKVFEEKVIMYKAMVRLIKEILSDGKISDEEVSTLALSTIELQMIGADETISAFHPVFHEINTVFQSSDADVVAVSGEQKMEIFTLLSIFAQKCRVDLGINEAELNKDVFKATVAEISTAVKGKRNMSKYQYHGKTLPKNRLVLEVIREYANNNKDVSFSELQKVFPDKLTFTAEQLNKGKGHKFGLIRPHSDGLEVKERTGHARYFMKDKELINLKEGAFCVCNQWGHDNVITFVGYCKQKLGLDIVLV